MKKYYVKRRSHPQYLVGINICNRFSNSSRKALREKDPLLGPIYHFNNARQ